MSFYRIIILNIKNYLGVKKFKFGEIESKYLTGVCTGLAWTEVGG